MTEAAQDLASRPLSKGAPLLAVRDLHAWYGESHILQGIDFDVGKGEVVTLLGRNGAGKSTTLKSIIGIVRRRTGSVRLQDQEIISLPSRDIAWKGVGYVPEERGIFASLNVHENLMLPPTVQAGGLTPEEVYTMFPNLLARRDSSGAKLSGGEQQMLAIARILRTGARFLLLDEPTEGLAPVIVEQIGQMIARLKTQGFTILLVEQNFLFAKTFGDRHYVMDQGRIVDMVTSGELATKSDKLQSYLSA